MSSHQSSVAPCYVVILNWNGWEDTIACINSLFDLPDANLHIVLVDNASTDESVDKIRESLLERTTAFSTLSMGLEGSPLCTVARGTGQKSVTLLCNNDNYGFAGGNNRGIAHVLTTRGENTAHLWLLNNDTTVHTKALEALRTASDNMNNRAVVGSKLLFYDEPTMVQSVGGKYNKFFGSTCLKGLYDRDEQWTGIHEDSIDYVMGASLFVPLDFAREIGLMEESYFLYYEEMDWILKGKKKGYRPVTALQSKVYHKVGRSIGSNPDGGKRSLLADFYLMRNRLLFTQRFYPRFQATVMLGLCASAVIRLRRGQRAHARQIFRILKARFCDNLENLAFQEPA